MARIWVKTRKILDFRFNARRVRWFFQRGKRGWSDADHWNGDGYLISVTVGVLDDLIKWAYGYPVDLGLDYSYMSPEEVRDAVQRFFEIDSQVGFTGRPGDGMGRWKAMLTYFRDGWAGVAEADDYLNELSKGEREQKIREWEEMIPLYITYFRCLWSSWAGP
jgi:hypothetical protein